MPEPDAKPFTCSAGDERTLDYFYDAEPAFLRAVGVARPCCRTGRPGSGD
ncbi:MAG: hypothetical protein ACHQIL_11385 [Steroidobacterales bacterium]